MGALDWQERIVPTVLGRPAKEGLGRASKRIMFKGTGTSACAPSGGVGAQVDSR